jgi:hypothetical protein
VTTEELARARATPAPPAPSRALDGPLLPCILDPVGADAILRADRHGHPGRRGPPAFEQKRDQVIEHLVAALALADEINDTATGYLIERALDEARAAIVPSLAGAHRQ